MGVIWFVSVALSLIFAPRVAGNQIPLLLDASRHDGHPWYTPPRSDETGHLIFDGVANLLTHWHATDHRNGHGIMPAIVSPGTLVFHGRASSVPAPGPEWLSFDADHSLLFTNYGNDSQLFVYSAKRELKLLYFDGFSAGVMPSGTQDTQNIVIYGNVTVDGSWNRYNPFIKIIQLCDWGKQYNIDGFLRMEFDFEVMYCNFTEGLQMVASIPVAPALWGRSESSGNSTLADRLPHGSFLNDSKGSEPPQDPSEPPPEEPPRRRPGGPGGFPRPAPPTRPPGWKGSMRDADLVTFESLVAGNRHNAAPVPGVSIDYSRLITFFDPKYKSLGELRRNHTRPEYRLLNISQEDAKLFEAELHEVWTRPANEKGSGVNWGAVTRHIVELYADRLEFVRYLLHSAVESSPQTVNLTETILDVHLEVLNMLNAYLTRDAVPGNFPSSNRSWLERPMRSCAYLYTVGLQGLRFSPQEHILKSSVEATTREVCRTLGLIWETAFDAESVSSPLEQATLLLSWKEEIDRLMEWLGWSLWLKCDPVCAPDEMCSIPQWPFDGVWRGTEDTTPHCMSRLHWKRGGFPGGGGGPRPGEPTTPHRPTRPGMAGWME